MQLKTLSDLDRGNLFLLHNDPDCPRWGGPSPLADNIRIEVAVGDANDFAPVFSVTEYRISLFEATGYLSFVTFHVSC